MMRNPVQERNVRLKKWDDKDQSYEGEFFGDSLHGQGTYRWNQTEVYEGGFFSNQKEGYAVLSFSNNSTFEGLFIKNRPFGPGILTHSNGRQDAGFWVGQNLVRLSRPVDFIVPRLAPTPAAKIKLLQFRRLITLNEKHDNSSETYILEKYGCSPPHRCLPYSNLIYDPRSIFFNHSAFEKAFFTKANNLLENLFEGRFLNKSEDFLESEALEYANKDGGERKSQSSPNPHCLCPDVFVMEYRDYEDSFDICGENEASRTNVLGLLGYYTKYGMLEDGESERKAEIDFGEGEEEEEEEEDEETDSPFQIVSWNRSELCTEMLKQIFRHRTFEAKLNFKIAKLMLGVRTEFRRTGEKEKECLEFLKMCSMGPARAVRDLLCRYELTEELMDSRGNTSLMFAAAADQHETIDLLLDYGVDANAFNDEGLTPLNLCLLRRLAQAHKICNWERAFLPTEIQGVTENNFKADLWKDEESIESLDRIFGDGTSADIKSEISQISEEPEGDTTEMEGERDTNTSDNGHQTTMMEAKMVPKSIRREEFEESVRDSPHDRYLFDLSSEPQPVEVEKKKDATRSTNRKIPREVDTIEDEEEEGEYEKKEVDPALVDKLTQIDKTIEILLRRGADPNISEAPKPSIHLGVFTKDVNVVSTLLRYGADPDCQTYPNEGLLTPLHVIALLKPAPENVEICQLLLKHGANVERETSPDFCIHDSEKEFLDNTQGRTPLQVLCMRPDLEYADPKGYVTQIGLTLAKYSDKKHFYKGHSTLTLTMLTGNIKLLTAFLKSNYFDPNHSVGNDLGTPLHVLVSTEFQKLTTYENSIKMCDLLLSAKADPLKEYKTPSKLIGTCIDYGYREIEEEKATRKEKGFGKNETKSSKQGKGGVRDHLKDHIKVVEYLEKKVSELKKESIEVGSYLEKSKVERETDSVTKLGNGERRKETGKQKVKKESETTILDEDRNVERSGRQMESKNFHQNDKAMRSKREDEPGNSGQTGKQNRENESKTFDEIGNLGETETEFIDSNQNGNLEKNRKQKRENERNGDLDLNGDLRKAKTEDESNNADQKGRNRREKESKTFNQNSDVGKPRRGNEYKNFDETENSAKGKDENEFKSFDRKGNPRNSQKEKEIENYDQTGRQRRGNQESETKNFDSKGNPKHPNRDNADQIGNQRKVTEQEGYNKIGKSEKPKHETEFKNFNSEGNAGNSKRQNEFKTSYQKGNSRGLGQEDDRNNPKEKGKLSVESNKKSFNQTENLRNSKRETKSKSYDQKESSGNRIQEGKSKGFERERDARENQDGGRKFDSRLGDALKKGHVGKNARKMFNNKMAEDKDDQKHIKPQLTSKSHKNPKSETLRAVKREKRESSLEDRKHRLRVFKPFSLSKYSSFRDRFPERLRQSMLQVLRGCVTIDVNKLLLPYVVLRNGDFYYMFKGRRPRKTEQYSLV